VGTVRAAAAIFLLGNSCCVGVASIAACRLTEGNGMVDVDVIVSCVPGSGTLALLSFAGDARGMPTLWWLRFSSGSVADEEARVVETWSD
jgi:hypothetical protein